MYFRIYSLLLVALFVVLNRFNKSVVGTSKNVRIEFRGTFSKRFVWLEKLFEKQESKKWKFWGLSIPDLWLEDCSFVFSRYHKYFYVYVNNRYMRPVAQLPHHISYSLLSAVPSVISWSLQLVFWLIDGDCLSECNRLVTIWRKNGTD